MDTTDPGIHFDLEGVCSHCHQSEQVRPSRLFESDELREKARLRLIEEIRSKGEGKEYDCIIGVSGGVDSTYVAYLVKKWGLRPLALHLDNGWNSELAVHNIHQALSRLNIDLHTEVLNWDEFRDLQLSFLKASTPDGEIPTDHAIFALLYLSAARFGIRYVLTGMNFRTEGSGTSDWSYGHHDWRYIKSVHKKFGSIELENYPHYSLSKLAYLIGAYGLKIVAPLNYIQYDKEMALKTMEEELMYRRYEAKHYESIYTRFYQGYVLPCKFGIDKRKLHFSDLIRSGQMLREEALILLESPPLREEVVSRDRVFVLKKLGLDEREFESIMSAPVRSYRDYPSNEAYARRLRRLFDALRRGNVIHK